jgi:hypothetical protein
MYFVLYAVCLELKGVYNPKTAFFFKYFNACLYKDIIKRLKYTCKY